MSGHAWVKFLILQNDQTLMCFMNFLLPHRWYMVSSVYKYMFVSLIYSKIVVESTYLIWILPLIAWKYVNILLVFLDTLLIGVLVCNDDLNDGQLGYIILVRQREHLIHILWSWALLLGVFYTLILDFLGDDTWYI